MIHAFIKTRLDYCNVLYAGIYQISLARLQSIQNTVTYLSTGNSKREHITPILASLHRLPVCFRINLKILLFVFKVLNGLAPQYILDLLHVYTPSRSLRYTDQPCLAVLKTRLKIRGDRTFSVITPELWDELTLSSQHQNGPHPLNF